jgi:metal-responsive CopG/Arc/MetJ family transcriptional regulator
VSAEADLLEEFDALIKKRSYGSRSEAIRDLIRERQAEEERKDENKETVEISGNKELLAAQSLF